MVPESEYGAGRLEERFSAALLEAWTGSLVCMRDSSP